MNNSISDSQSAETCRICMQLFVEPYSTTCGHTFCRNCIIRHVNQISSCPVCSTDIDVSNNSHLIPNHTAAALISKMRRNRQEGFSGKRTASGSTIEKDNSFPKSKKNCDVPLTQPGLLCKFLDHLIEDRNAKINQLITELHSLEKDRNRVRETTSTEPFNNVQRTVPDLSSIEAQMVSEPQPLESKELRKRLNPNFSSLESCYFDLRNNSNDSTTDYPVGSLGSHLEEFSIILSNMSRYAEVRRLATLNYNIESSSPVSIVSSIEFDRDGEYFVVAGVSKKIKLYDYNAVVSNCAGVHYPIQQMQCSSKISNVSWNPYIKSVLASSDYDGAVQLWDVEASKCTRLLKEHEKRCWTVQFNNVDPHLMASGSDDAKVKLWSMNAPTSLLTVDAKVNVCCVYFSPQSRNNFVFGSADHCVHLYDLRHTSKALNVFRGHRKAVSYVKYVNAAEVVSAQVHIFNETILRSTDNTLRLWDVNTGVCKRVLMGHQNEKNFVGLATDGNHIVCGSENNHLYIYYKHVTEPLLRYDFTSPRNEREAQDAALISSTESSNSDFVSAVCWRKGSNVVVAANSHGTTQVLELL